MLTLGELQVPLNLVDCAALDHAELDQIRHWKPGTAGELIFNYWRLKPAPAPVMGSACLSVTHTAI
jgi:hypothetical protein